jgi:hypothetical protein
LLTPHTVPSVVLPSRPDLQHIAFFLLIEKDLSDKSKSQRAAKAGHTDKTTPSYFT